MWEILEIEKTKNSASIKSAYTKKRGVVAAQDAKMLSTAYEFALRHAKIIGSAESWKEELLLELAFIRYWKNHDASTSQDLKNEAANIGDAVDTGSISSDPTQKSPVYEEFYMQMRKIYDNFFVRRELINWQDLVSQSAFRDSNKAAVEPAVQDFLLVHRNLPSAVWTLFESEHHWNDKIDKLIVSNPEFARCLLIETCPRWPLDYSFVKRENVFDYEKYISCRGLTREAALENSVEQVRANFDNAIDIYTNDPNLYEAVADFYSSQPPFNKYGEFGPEFLHALNKLIKLHFNDSKYIRERAEYYKRCEYFEEARDDYETAMKLNPEELRLPYEIADTFYLQNLMGSAKPYLKYIKKIYQKTQSALEKQMSTTQDRERISAIIDSNDAVIGEVFDKLK